MSYEESISLDVVGDSSSTIMPSRLMKCIALLASVVLEDCRFLVSGARLTRPPGALQAITLDVAQFLAALHCDNPITIYEISCAVMPAFFTFPAQMHTRLVSFFQENILRRILRPLGLADLLGPDELRFDQSRGKPYSLIDYVPHLYAPQVILQAAKSIFKQLRLFPFRLTLLPMAAC